MAAHIVATRSRLAIQEKGGLAVPHRGRTNPSEQSLGAVLGHRADGLGKLLADSLLYTWGGGRFSFYTYTTHPLSTCVSFPRHQRKRKEFRRTAIPASVSYYSFGVKLNSARAGGGALPVIMSIIRSSRNPRLPQLQTPSRSEPTQHQQTKIFSVRSTQYAEWAVQSCLLVISSKQNPPNQTKLLGT